MAEKNDGLLKGLIIGGLMGMVIGIVFAPRSGKETREKLAKKTEEFLAKAKEEYEKAAEKGKDFLDASKQRLKDLGTSVTKREAAEAVGETLPPEEKTSASPHKNRFKKALDAGLEAYKKEVEPE